MKSKPDDPEWHHDVGKDKKTKELFKKRGWSEKKFKNFRDKHGTIATADDHRFKKDSIHSKKWNQAVRDEIGQLKGKDFNEKNIMKAVDKLKQSDNFKSSFKNTFDAGDVDYKTWGKAKSKGTRQYAKKLLGMMDDMPNTAKKLASYRGMATKALSLFGVAGIGMASFSALGNENVHREYQKAYEAFKSGDKGKGWHYTQRMGLEMSMSSGTTAPFLTTATAQHMVKNKNYGYTEMMKDHRKERQQSKTSLWGSLVKGVKEVFSNLE